MTNLLERYREHQALEPESRKQISPWWPWRPALTVTIVLALLVGVTVGLVLFNESEQTRLAGVVTRVQEIRELRNAQYATGMAERWLLENPQTVTDWRARAMVEWYEDHYAQELRLETARETLARQQVAWYEDRYLEVYEARIAAGG